MIPVTKPYLPSIEKFQNYVYDIYRRQWLTNNGPLVNEYELRLKDYLSLNHLLFVSNGTIALQIAIKALNLKGEIITTPFSYIATTSSIVWEGCKPYFVDIDRETLNIDHEKIEEAINDDTSAILATHCFGNACNIDAIENIAKKHNLRVIYDAAHCFGTKFKGKSIFEYGDVSTASLHATKLIHSVEGGLLFTTDGDLLRRMSKMRNFGHDGPEEFDGVGINAKNSEFHAAMGLLVLEDVDKILEKRKKQSCYYDQVLRALRIAKPKIQNDCESNFSYYPIIFESESICLASKKELELNEIYPRRYFYPSLSKLEYVDNHNTKCSDDISKRILCLPLYHDLSQEEQDMIARLLLRVQNN